MVQHASPRAADQQADISPVARHLWIPNVARFWNAAAGGKDNVALDRGLVAQANKIGVIRRWLTEPNHRFLLRTAQHLVKEERITQFLVLGPGLPPDGVYLHHIVQSLNLTAKVLYVDNDPVVLAHARALDGDRGLEMVVDADIFEPKSLLGRKEVTKFLDWSAPIAIICTAVLHYHPGDTHDVAAVMQTYIDAAADGSCTVVSHFLDAGEAATAAQKLEALLSSGLDTPARFRSLPEIAELFPDQEVLPPGVVPCPHWPEREDDDLTPAYIAGGIGKKQTAS